MYFLAVILMFGVVMGLSTIMVWGPIFLSLFKYFPVKIKTIEYLHTKNEDVIITVIEENFFGLLKREMKYQSSKTFFENNRYSMFVKVVTGESYRINCSYNDNRFCDGLNALLIQERNKKYIEKALATHYEHLIKTADDELTNKIESLTKQKDSMEKKRQLIKSRVENPSVKDLTNEELYIEIEKATAREKQNKARV